MLQVETTESASLANKGTTSHPHLNRLKPLLCFACCENQ